MKEQDIENDLCIGEVLTENALFFDHSWIEIDGRVFDIAIQLTLQNETNPPVYAGYDLYTKRIAYRVYGVDSPSGFDLDAKKFLKPHF